MDWQEHIVIDPEILVGKPVIRGTRLAVEFILDPLAPGRPYSFIPVSLMPWMKVF